MAAITKLQEICAKQKITLPQYELEHDGHFSQLKTFIIKCTAMNQSAIGHGSSKKEAKLDSATNLLKLLNYEVEEYQHKNVTDNFEEELATVCLELRCPIPNYKLLGESGLPHQLEFTYECVFGKIRFEATASTKKGAKQLAAKKMYLYLTTDQP